MQTPSWVILTKQEGKTQYSLHLMGGPWIPYSFINIDISYLTGTVHYSFISVGLQNI